MINFEILLSIILVIAAASAATAAAYDDNNENLNIISNIDNFVTSNAQGIGTDSSGSSSNNYSENNNIHFNAIFNKSTVDSVNINDDENNIYGKFDESARKLRRGKRYLDFVKGTRVSWRTTMKNNILQVNTLWGYGWGFRSNFPFPDKADRLRPFFKRDLLHATVEMLDRHDLDGRACLLKSYCMTKLDSISPIGGGMIFKLLKMLLSLDHVGKRHFPYLNMDNCYQILHTHCPLSFNSISPYTDDV